MVPRGSGPPFHPHRSVLGLDDSKAATVQEGTALETNGCLLTSRR